MAYKYNVTQESGYLHFTISGNAHNAEDARQFAYKVIVQAEASACSNIFFDEKKLETNLTSHDIYTLAEEFSGLIVSEGFRIAALHTARNAEVGKMFETMLQNRSINYRTFMDKKEALNWLLA